ncbi:MAG: hypothetical protein LBE78_13750 [Burkholderiaceae bacterium]|jgi:hypothetical protein|nr:hypothetical protein [Burkholderiaceae bacterium]
MCESAQIYSIPPELVLARLQQAQALTDFWVTVWSANPRLACQAGRRVEEFMLSRHEVQRRHAHDLENGG